MMCCFLVLSSCLGMGAEAGPIDSLGWWQAEEGLLTLSRLICSAEVPRPDEEDDVELSLDSPRATTSLAFYDINSTTSCIRLVLYSYCRHFVEGDLVSLVIGGKSWFSIVGGRAGEAIIGDCLRQLGEFWLLKRDIDCWRIQAGPFFVIIRLCTSSGGLIFIRLAVVCTSLSSMVATRLICMLISFMFLSGLPPPPFVVIVRGVAAIGCPPPPDI